MINPKQPYHYFELSNELKVCSNLPPLFFLFQENYHANVQIKKTWGILFDDRGKISEHDAG